MYTIQSTREIIMATRIAMKHEESGIMKVGYYGFSWTTLFFWIWPALFRGDFITFIGGLVIPLIIGAFLGLFLGIMMVEPVWVPAAGSVVGVPIWLAWAFMYNKYYTLKLIGRGYALSGSEGDNAIAAAALGLVCEEESL